MADDSRIIPFELAGPYAGAMQQREKARKIIDRIAPDPGERERLWKLFRDAIAADE